MIYAGLIYQLYFCFEYGKVYMMTSSSCWGLAFLPFVLLLVMVDMISGIKYKKSKKFKGRVIDSIDTEIVYFGRRYGEIYETYDVCYNYKGQTLRGEVCTDETGLRRGDKIDVYVYDPDNLHEIQSDIGWRKSQIFAGCAVGIIVILLMFFLFMWAMDQTNYDSQYKDKVTVGGYYNSYEYNK